MWFSAPTYAVQTMINMQALQQNIMCIHADLVDSSKPTWEPIHLSIET